MKHLDAQTSAADIGRREFPATWLSVGAMARLLAVLMVLAALWLLVAWAVTLP